MPLYEYGCSKCGKKFEVLQNIKSAALHTCLYCCGKAKRLISLSSFQLKGSGWYVNDYKKKPAEVDPKKDVSVKQKTEEKKDHVAHK